MDAQLERVTVALADRYGIERELGRGGMATVYLAEDLKHHRKVAVKVLHPDLTAAVGADRFLREIEIAANLTHPHILPVHDSGEADGCLYFVMPYVEGESLRARLERESQLPVDDAIRIAREVADALSYAHARGVLHRDVKPANMLLEAGHAVLADFGIAKAAAEVGTERLTETGVSLGTPTYTSPEQASGEGELDGRSDLYSLGCVLYEMLVGEPPFTGPNAAAVLAKKLTGPPPVIRDTREAVPAAVERVTVRALARSAADRFRTVSDFGDALGAAAALESAAPAGGARGWGARVRPWSFAALGLALALAVGWIVMYSPRGSPGAAAGGDIAGPEVPAPTPLPTTDDRPPRIPLILADFENNTTDPDLAVMTVEALRVDLAGSPVIRVVSRDALGDALRRMGLDPATTGLGRRMATELAQREGIPLVVAGSVDAVGGALQFLAELIRPSAGGTTSGHRVVAADSGRIIDAIGELASRLRRDAGESAESVTESAPLPQVTTSSLEALRYYARGVRLGDEEGAFDRAAELLERAVAADPGFAMAYRLLGVWLSNAGSDRARAIEAFTRAYRLSERSTEPERLSAALSYHGAVTGDAAAMAAAARATVDLYPDHLEALANLGLAYLRLGYWEASEEASRRAIDVGPLTIVPYINLAQAQIRSSAFARAQATIAEAAELFPESHWVAWMSVELARARGDFAAAEAHLGFLARFAETSPLARRTLFLQRTLFALRRGQLDAAVEWTGRLRESWVSAEHPGQALQATGRTVTALARLAGRPERAASELERALTEFPLARMAPYDRPYLVLAEAWAHAGRPEESRALLAEYERAIPSDARGVPDGQPGHFESVLARVLMAEGSLDAAIQLLRQAERSQCVPGRCELLLARAHDMAQRPDSALVWYERFLDRGHTVALGDFYLATTLERLAQLHETRGREDRAVELYRRFISLWEEADPELRPRVEAAKARIASGS